MSVRSIGLTAGLVIVLLSLGIAFQLANAYREYTQVSESVTAIVKSDIAHLETVLEAPSMQTWREYLSLGRLRELLESDDYAAQKEIDIFLVKLQEAEGAEKYAEMQLLRSSLKVLVQNRKHGWGFDKLRHNPARDFVLERASQTHRSFQTVPAEEKSKPMSVISRKPLLAKTSKVPLLVTSQLSLAETKTVLAQNAACDNATPPASAAEDTTIQDDSLPVPVETDEETADEYRLTELPPLPVCEKKWRSLLADPKPSDTFADNPFANVAKAWKENAEKYVVPNDADREVARETLLGKIADLEELLKTDATKEAGWKKMLTWDKLQKASQSDPVDIVALQEVHERFCRGAVGLELVRFAAVRLAIQRCVAIDASGKKPDQAKANFAKVARTLSVLLDDAGKKTDADTLRSIETCLRWVRVMGQVPELVKQTESLWSQPNLRVTVRQEALDKVASRKISEDQKLNEQVANASIVGTAHFDGTASIRLQPNTSQAQFQVVLSGTSKGISNAYSGPVVVQSSTTGQIFASKDIFFDATGLLTSAAEAKIKADSQIIRISDRFGRRMIENIAARKASEQRGTTQQILCSRQEARMSKRMDAEVDDLLAVANGQFLRLLRTQLNPRGFAPESFQMSSTDKEMNLVGSLSANGGLMASQAVPVPAKESPIQFAIHETAVQNLFSGFLSGMVLNPNARETLEKTLPESLQKSLEKSMASDEKEKNADAWGITFPFQNPIAATFAEGRICVTIHTRTIKSTDKEYPNMDITVVYRLDMKEGKPSFVREGVIDVLPSDFDPAVSKRLPSNIVSLRRVMSRRLKEALPERIELQPIPLQSRGEPAKQSLVPDSLTIQDGWFLMGLHLE